VPTQTDFEKTRCQAGFIIFVLPSSLRRQFADFPDVISNPGFHRWSHAQQPMNPAEVVIRKVQAVPLDPAQ
jgi:hypothetical protein